MLRGMARGKTGGHPDRRRRKELRVIPEPQDAARPIVAPADAAALNVIGGFDGAPDFVCGSCGRVLTRGARRAELVRFVLRCGGCGAFNDAAGGAHEPELR
jgi:hypothetical protein